MNQEEAIDLLWQAKDPGNLMPEALRDWSDVP